MGLLSKVNELWMKVPKKVKQGLKISAVSSAALFLLNGTLHISVATVEKYCAIDNACQIYIHELDKEDFRKKHFLLGQGCSYNTLVNSMGYCDDEFVVTKTPEKKRILSLGESSYVFDKIEFNFLKEIETDNLEIYNFNLPGLNLAEKLYILSTEAKKYADSSDVVLLNFNLETDFYNYMIDSLCGFGQLEEITKENQKKNKKGKYSEKSKRIHKKLMEEMQKQKKEISYESLQKIREFNSNIHNEREYKSENQFIQEQINSFLSTIIHIDESYPGTFLVLDRMRELAHGRLVIVITPKPYQIDDHLFMNMADINRDVFELKRNRYTDYTKIKEYCKKNKIFCIDPLYSLRDGHKKYLRVFYKNNNFFNYWGNQIKTEEIKLFFNQYFIK